MRVLEARFHPCGKEREDFVVVAHVVWNWLHRQQPRILAAPSQPGMARESVISKLRYLVSLTSPGAFERLQSLPNRFWSFVDVGSPPHKGGS